MSSAPQINNDMAKERAFYCLNEQFVSYITYDIIFLRRPSERLGNKHLASDLLTCAKQTIFPESKKLLIREQRTIETLINNYVAKDREFYCLNEQFVSNVTGDIQRRSSERFGNKHLVSDLRMRAKRRFFP